MKMLVVTTGQFSLQCMDSKQVIHSARPCVIFQTEYLSNRLALKQWRMLAHLKDEATDEEFVEYLKESGSDRELAIQSFIAAFGADAKIDLPPVKADTKVDPATPVQPVLTPVPPPPPAADGGTAPETPPPPPPPTGKGSSKK
jgi:hypothetical protein